MDRPEPVLRIARPEDAGAITQLMKRSAAAIFPAYYGADKTQSAVDYVARIDPTLLADGTYFVLEAGDDMVACGGWSRRDRLYTGSRASAGDGRTLDPDTEPARVRAMFVHPDWTRRGLGRRVLEECERAAAREGYRTLALMATLPGVLLYQAFGFESVGPQQDVTLEDGVALLCVPMEKPIDGPPRALGRHTEDEALPTGS